MTSAGGNFTLCPMRKISYSTARLLGIPKDDKIVYNFWGNEKFYFSPLYPSVK